MILGVSGWIGQKIGLDETVVRILFVVLFFGFGVGLGLYLILWILKLISK